MKMPVLPSVTFNELFNVIPLNIAQKANEASNTSHLSHELPSQKDALLYTQEPQHMNQSHDKNEETSSIVTESLPDAFQLNKSAISSEQSPPSDTKPTKYNRFESFDRLLSNGTDKETAEELRTKAETGNNAVISQFDARGKQGRRLTFVMQEVPDVLVKGVGGRFIQDAQLFCGSDILGEDIPSEDDEWSPKDLQNEMSKTTSGLTEKDLEESLTNELLAANDETDLLYRLDSLADGGQKRRTTDGNSSPDTTISSKNDKLTSNENVDTFRTDLPEVMRSALKTSTMNDLQLRLWFMRVRKSYKNKVKVIKVSEQGKKFVRTIVIDDSFLRISRPHHTEQRCHLSCIKTIKLGFASDAFSNLLEITAENDLVPPHQSCVEVILPNQSVSLIFPSEQARNEFLLLLRVLVNQAKRIYGDNSSL